MSREANKTLLDNGIRILTRKIPHVRSVSMGVWVNVGARDETPAESGLSHFIEHMLFKGTRRRSAYDIAKDFDAIGGQTNGFTSMELTCFHARVMDSHLETMVDILSDIFLNSIFDPLEVEKERPVIIQEIGMVEDSPEEYIHNLLCSAFWGDNPLGRSIIGPRENIAGFKPETIKDFFLRFYQPDRIVISAAGNINHDKFVDLVEPLFESIVPGDGLPARITPNSQFKQAVCKRELEQVHICMAAKGLKTTHEDRYTLSLMNTILGGNMSSRLFQEIRERKGLAYSVYSFLNSYSDTGMFGLYAGVSPSNIEESIDLMIRGLKGLYESAIMEAEIGEAKEFIKGNILLSSEGTDSQMVRLAQNEMIFGRDIHLSEIIDKIDHVEAEDIQRLANDLFLDDQLALTILGPVEEGFLK